MTHHEYSSHSILKELESYIKFYKLLSFSIFQFIPLGTSATANIDSYILSSIQGTVESIKLILREGKINDAYALTRKYHDSVVINIYEILYLKEHFSLENLRVAKINNWLTGKAKLPRYADMIKYIKNCKELNEANNLMDLDGFYDNIRKRCNDHTHYNLFYYVMVNDKDIHLERRTQILDDLAKDIRSIFIQHFIWLFTISGHYMVSSEYIDCFEMGLPPEEDSQYLVAPFIQEMFDSVIKVQRKDLADLLKHQTNMKLE